MDALHAGRKGCRRDEDLRPFLAEWHPKLKAWLDQKNAEADWDGAVECREALAVAQGKALEHTRKLGDVLGVQRQDAILGKPLAAG